MKFIILTILAALAAALSGCESMGWDGTVFHDTLTPGVDAETSVRTWDANGKPHVQEVPNDPAFQ